MGTAEGDTAYKVTNGTNDLESPATGPPVFVERIRWSAIICFPL
ncbi:hypothetical protein [Nonomuraea sp. C10]|nr:hypothetical protein [Nonomuraea sp. C10]